MDGLEFAPSSLTGFPSLEILILNMKAVSVPCLLDADLPKLRHFEVKGGSLAWMDYCAQSLDPFLLRHKQLRTLSLWNKYREIRLNLPALPHLRAFRTGLHLKSSAPPSTVDTQSAIASWAVGSSKITHLRIDEANGAMVFSWLGAMKGTETLRSLELCFANEQSFTQFLLGPVVNADGSPVAGHYCAANLVVDFPQLTELSILLYGSLNGSAEAVAVRSSQPDL